MSTILRRLRSASVVRVVVAAAVALSLGTLTGTGTTTAAFGASQAPAANFAGQQLQSTLDRLVKEALKIAHADHRDSLTAADLESALAKLGNRAWEQGVDFAVTSGFSGGVGDISVYTGPDGTVGIAVGGDDDSSCAMATIASGDRRAQMWSFDVPLGKSCSGKVAAAGETDAAPPFVDPVPPAAPVDVTVTAGDGELVVSWSASAEADVTGYRLYVDGQVAASQSGAGTTVTGLVNYTTYQVTVTAVDEADNESVPSVPVAGTPVDLTPPPVPTDLMAVPGDRQVTLTWSATLVDDFAHFIVYVDGAAVAEPTQPEFEVTGLTNGTAYRLSVAAVDVHGNASAMSTPVVATPLAAVDDESGDLGADPARTSYDTGWRIANMTVPGGRVRELPEAVTDQLGRIYVAGGRYSTNRDQRLARVDRYNPATGTWTSLPPMITPRIQFELVVDAQNRVYAIGGGTWGQEKLVERFDPVMGVWEPVAPMRTARLNGFTAVTDADGVLWVIGGYLSIGNGGGWTGSVEKYDPATNTWSWGPALPESRGFAAATVDGRGNIYVMGGWAGSGSLFKSVRVYDQRWKIWRSAPDMPHATESPESAIDAAGRIYVAGGATSSGTQISTTVRFVPTSATDPSRGYWQTVPSGFMKKPRSEFSLVHDSAGRFYAIGGRIASWLGYFTDEIEMLGTNPDVS